MLGERYGDEQASCDSHYAQLYSLNEPSDTLSALRTFYDTMEANLRALESRGKVSDSDGGLLNFLKHRLPLSVRLELGKMRGASDE